MHWKLTKDKGPLTHHLVARVPCEASRGSSVGRTGHIWLSAPRCSAALLQNYRKSSRHLAPFINKFVQFTHRYITCNAPAAVAFLQKYSDALQ